MDWKAGDILYSYQGNYDADGNFVPGKEIKAKCTGIDAAGKPEIAVLTGAEFLESGTRMIRVGSFNTAARQKGMFFDTITASAPRLVIYNGFNNYNKFSEDYIVDPSLYITVAGALDSVYNENLGGYLTGQVGLYTKSLFADISGSSKLYIREDANNYIYFDEGNLSLSATRFSLTSTNLGIFSGASAMILLGHPTLYASAKIGLKNDGSGKLASGNISWDTSGNVTQTGTWTSTATITGGTFQTAGSGNRVVMNSSGLYGYDNTLGTTFSLPTNGDKPTFSSGIIKEVEFEIYTSGIIRTSATVGSGSSNSAGVLMNNTGLYGFGANQNTSSANFKLLASTGEIFAKLGTIGGFTIGATSITSTNVGWHSGASAMFLLGHATDYASAKIGLKNDGSGKLASGNISWDTTGNVTQTGTWTSTATITGAIIKTATTGPRITINESGYANTIRFYDSNGDFVGGLYGDYGWLGVNGILNADYGINIPDNSYVIWGIPTFSRYGASIHSSTNGSNATIGILQGNTAPTQGSDYICYMDLSGFSVGGKQSGVTYARLDYLGRLTKVNNLAASSYTGYVLRSDGTSFTPQQLAFGSFSTTYYLAPSSGGSPTIPVRILPYTVGSTTRYLLAVE